MYSIQYEIQSEVVRFCLNKLAIFLSGAPFLVGDGGGDAMERDSSV